MKHATKTVFLVLLALAALPARTLFAQELAGAWQGTMQAPAPGGGTQALRILVRIAGPGNGTVTGVLYSLDQTPQGIPVGEVTGQNGVFRFTVPGAPVVYEGRFAADGNSVAGTWTQPGAAGIALTLVRATPQTAWETPQPAAPRPLAANAPLVFDVATIKPTRPGTPGKLFRQNGRAFTTVNTSVSDILTFVYGLHAKQIVNGPAWIETEMYDITGTPEAEGQPTIDQWKTMLGKLLADRFKFTFHRDTRELAAYALTVGRNGPRMTKNDTNANGLPALFFTGLGAMTVRNATMTDFAAIMQGAVMDRPVVDQTKLSGRFDFLLKWTPDESQFGGLGVRVPPPTDDPSAPAPLFSAIQDQIGLRLEATRAPVDIIVIDTVDHPTPN